MRAYAKILQCTKPPFILKRYSASTKPKVETIAPVKVALKKLPVPSLNLTLRKFLRTARPFLSSDEFIKSEAIMKEFGSPGGLGEQLHFLLEERAEAKENWLEEWWLNTAYLGYRQPVVVFSSPGQIFPLQVFKSDEDYLKCATKVVLGALDYKRKIDEGKIKQEMMGRDPLDMDQYYKVFGTNRSPGEPLDHLKYFPKAEHIMVVCNNEFYRVDIKQDGKLIDPNVLYKKLEYILHDAKEPGCPIGILTTECRDTWTEAYGRLKTDCTNMQNLRQIELSSFILCLDRACPKPLVNNKSTTSAQVIHGGGPNENSGNRWYDKTLQFVISRDGGVGIAYEHSPAEGGLIASIMDHIIVLLEKDLCIENPCGQVENPTKLNFNLDQCMLDFVEKAKGNLNQLVQNLEFSCFSFDDYGKDAIKQFKLSPDSYIQMAIQYAFYRIHKVPGAHYETASLRRFAKGRTEAIRSCSEESVDFAKAMLNESLPCVSKARVLRQAIEAHKLYAMEAMDMKAVDRYLLGLRLIAEENCLPRPPIFDDPAYKRSVNFRLSTSQVPSKTDGFMVYAPLTEDGYGCCYNPREKNINFGTSAFRSTGETSAPLFRESLELALQHMKQVLLESPVAKL